MNDFIAARFGHNVFIGFDLETPDCLDVISASGERMEVLAISHYRQDARGMFRDRRYALVRAIEGMLIHLSVLPNEKHIKAFDFLELSYIPGEGCMLRYDRQRVYLMRYPRHIKAQEFNVSGLIVVLTRLMNLIKANIEYCDNDLNEKEARLKYKENDYLINTHLYEVTRMASPTGNFNRSYQRYWALAVRMFQGTQGTPTDPAQPYAYAKVRFYSPRGFMIYQTGAGVGCKERDAKLFDALDRCRLGDHLQVVYTTQRGAMTLSTTPDCEPDGYGEINMHLVSGPAGSSLTIPYETDAIVFIKNSIAAASREATEAVRALRSA
ncbi:hypothetical protein PQC06_gp157 [Aeromonas phage LAh10]|uniref:Uncharacterized protein n=1 Tax=Aeromonas phage LAh10 TaxID=2591025 RepID=A0A514A1D1_9CAUD|nr:hypothetical protein PQC06_gp157 [Aeromonas phage LAh10]QDH47083.1 hypothetical protein LAh10_157 [Aeromonas phage LAh10]